MKKELDVNGIVLVVVSVVLGLVIIAKWDTTLFSDAKRDLLIVLTFILILLQGRRNKK